jgi:transcriptional regulator with XRE-family HTH domain
MEESFGPLLTRVRLARGWSQLHVAALLCAASGVATVTRNELSRWERGERVPSRFWLGWLALVLEVSLDELTRAATRSRRRRPATGTPAGAPWVSPVRENEPVRASGG